MTTVALRKPATWLRRRSTWIGAAVTIATFAAGTALVTWVIPSRQTPTSVAQAYAEARFSHDWPAEWSLLCERTRDERGDMASFVQSRPDLQEEKSVAPSNLDIEIGEVRAVPRSDPPAVLVSFTVTAHDPKRADWGSVGDLYLVEEDGELRVCS